MPSFTPWQPPPTPEHTEAWSIGPNFSAEFDHFSVHRHAGYEFFLHVQGGGFYQLDQHVFPLQPYQLLLIHPHQLHGPVSRHPLRHFERILVQVNENVLGQLRFDGASLLDVVDQCIAQASPQIIVSPQEYLQLRTLTNLIRPAGELTTACSRAEALGYLTALISRLCQSAAGARQTSHTMGREGLILQVRDHILAHFTQDCSLDALAERFSISKFHLSHLFTQICGTSVHQFVLHCRMAYAQKLIRQGEPMMSISYQCGFNDYSSFVRAFTRFYGANPRTWRKQQLLQRQRTAARQD